MYIEIYVEKYASLALWGICSWEYAAGNMQHFDKSTVAKAARAKVHCALVTGPGYYQLVIMYHAITARHNNQRITISISVAGTIFAVEQCSGISYGHRPWAIF